MLDGGAQRSSAPCVLRRAVGTELRLANLGSAPLRALALAPLVHDADADCYRFTDS